MLQALRLLGPRASRQPTERKQGIGGGSINPRRCKSSDRKLRNPLSETSETLNLSSLQPFSPAKRCVTDPVVPLFLEAPRSWHLAGSLPNSAQIRQARGACVKRCLKSSPSASTTHSRFVPKAFLQGFLAVLSMLDWKKDVPKSSSLNTSLQVSNFSEPPHFAPRTVSARLVF